MARKLFISFFVVAFLLLFVSIGFANTKSYNSYSIQNLSEIGQDASNVRGAANSKGKTTIAWQRPNDRYTVVQARLLLVDK